MIPTIHSMLWAGALVLTLGLAVVSAGRQQLDTRSMYGAGLLGMLGALWGGTLLAQAMVLHGGNIDTLRIIQGEKGVFGASAGAAILGIGFLFWRRLPVLDYVDAAMPAIFLGYAMMRILCFLEGHCFGTPTDLPWAVRFAPATEAYADHLARGWVTAHDALSLPVHPTQLYHAAVGYIAFVILLRIKTAQPGTRLAAALLIYGATRFVIEFLRGDAVALLGGLDPNHLASLLMVAIGLAVWRLRPAVATAALRGEPA